MSYKHIHTHSNTHTPTHTHTQGIYTLELLVNMYGHWFYEFFTSAWSLFDLFIVAISLFELVYMEYMAPGMYVCMNE